MMTSTPGHSLDAGLAIRDGWRAFLLSPWSFVGFAVVATILSSLVDLLPSIAGFLATTLIDLWISIGLVRGAWIALDGRKPTFADLAALNGPAIWRLFSSQFLLALLLLPIALIVIGVALTAAEVIQPATRLLNLSFTSDLSDPQQLNVLIPGYQAMVLKLMRSPVALVALLSGWGLAVYVQVNQSFLGFIALLDGQGPIATIRHGFARVKGQWWQVFGLLVLQTVILLIGVLLMVLGLLAAVPLVFCITGAAYRQLFGSDDRAAFLKGQ